MVQTVHHQGNSRYGESARMQRTSNAHFAIIFSAIKSIDIWEIFNLDYILEQGENIFK